MRLSPAGAVLLRAIIAAALTGLATCEPLPLSSVPSQSETSTALQPAAPRVNAVIPGDRNRQGIFEARGVPTSPALPTSPSAGAGGEEGDVTLTFVDTDIREIVRTILGTTLKLNYTIDPSVQGTASLEIAKPLPRSQVLPTLETLLNQNGATLIVRNGIYRVAPLAAGAVIGSEAVGASTQIVALKYASAKELAKVLEPYVTEGGKIAADSARNALIVSGDSAVRQTLTGLIRAFDIDSLAGQSYAVFPAGDSSPDKLASELEKVFRSENDGPLSGVVRVLPMERVHAVLVVSAQPRYIDEARRFLGLERRVEDATARAWHVYYVQNGQSADLEALLQRAFTPGHIAPSAAPPGTTAPTAEPARTSSALGGRGTASASGFGQSQSGGTAGGASTLAAAAVEKDTANPATEPLSATAEAGSGGAEDRIRILANRRNNALLIYATPSEYVVIEGMLRKIDIIPLQVLIEATIAEVTLNDQLTYGTQFFLGHKLAGALSLNGPQSILNGLPPGASGIIAGQAVTLAPGLPGFVFGNGAREVINALSAVTELKVLSAPQVLVSDNEPARLQVGSLVPVQIQSQQSTLTSNAPIVNSIDYRDTGVILSVTPRVNSGGLVSLDISQEVSDVASETTGNINSPTFDQRLIRTRLAVQDGQTVGIAGLIRDSDSRDNQGIPVIKDIPVLGTLFSNQSNARTRTELLVLITPHVVRDQRDARALTEDLRKQLIRADAVPQALRRQPFSGSANPNHW